MVKTVRLADIAEKMEVSVVTVSKALSGQKGVSEELRGKIKKLADEMGYKPVHPVKKEKNKSYTIGVIVLESYFTKFDSFYWKMYQEVAAKAIKQNCFTMLEIISNTAEKTLQPVKLLSEARVDCILVIGKPRNEYLNMLCQYKKVPMVFMDFYDEKHSFDAVISDSFYGSYHMTRYLTEMGHRKIAYVGTLQYTGSITDRYFGYCKALLEIGEEVRQDWVLNDRNPENGIIGLDYQFTLPNEMPTAFVCNNDIAAYALIYTLESKGYRVPEDISVVGYDDYLYTEYGDSKITTYAVDLAEMSKIAVNCLIEKIENGSQQARVHIVPGKIIVRNTVGRYL